MVQPVIRAAAGLTAVIAVLAAAVPAASGAAGVPGGRDGGGLRAEPPGQVSGWLGRVRWRECGDGLRCGRLAVPVDWKRPRGARTEIDLAWLPARDPGRSLGPLVVNTGAGSTIQGVRARPDTVSELARWFDVVLIEPRGIGDRGSTAMVRCSVPPPDPRRLQMASGEAAWRSYAGHNAAYDRSCRIASGPAYDGLTAWQVAHDLDALRDALGQRRLRYFGNGYGAVHGQAYLELFPGRVGRMYLEGVPDHSEPGLGRRLLTRARAAERQLRSFRDWCAGRLECPLGGDAIAVLDDLLDRAPLPLGPGHGRAPLAAGPERRPAPSLTAPGRERASPAADAGHGSAGSAAGRGRVHAGSPGAPGPGPRLGALFGEAPLVAGARLGRMLGGAPSGAGSGLGGLIGEKPSGRRAARGEAHGRDALHGRAGRVVGERRIVTAVLAGLEARRWPELARALAAAEEGDARALAALANVRRFAAPATVSRAMHCHDFMPAVPGYRSFLRLEARLRKVAPRVGWLTARYEVGRCLGLDTRPSRPPRPLRIGRSLPADAGDAGPAGDGEGRPSPEAAADRRGRTGVGGPSPLAGRDAVVPGTTGSSLERRDGLLSDVTGFPPRDGDVAGPGGAGASPGDDAGPESGAVASPPRGDDGTSGRNGDGGPEDGDAGGPVGAERGGSRGGRGARPDRRESGVAVLIGIGRLDLVSPPAGAARVAGRIPGAAVLWHGDGHDAYLLQGAAKLRAACLRARVHDFLVNGVAPAARTVCPGELTAGGGHGE